MIIENWIKDISEPKLRAKILDLRQRYVFLADNLFCEYEPTKKAPERFLREFMLRTEKWLAQISDDKQRQTAFRSIEYIFFAGREEFNELHRCTFEELKRWLLEINEIDPFDSEEEILSELNSSWICPITDSLRINSFLHINGISGGTFRPDWHSMRKFAREEEVCNYIDSHDVKYLILIEDFVGSGSQVLEVLQFVTSIVDIPILVIPQIICATGMEVLREASIEWPSTCIRPIIVIPKNCLVAPDKEPGEPELFDLLREVMKQHYDRLNHSLKGKEFGFGKTGSMVVTYSNCPDNTPPLFHRALEGEIALFPRLDRPWSS